MSNFARFGQNRTQLTSHTGLPLTEDQIMRVAPSVFATAPHDSRSDRFAFIPTIEVLRGLRKEGFEPFMVAQSQSRTPGKSDFTKHMIRLRHADQIARTEVNESILINSHDGTSSYHMLGGCFRFVCCNGLIVASSMVEDVKVKHTGNVIGEVIDGAFRMLNGFERVDASRDAMKAIQLAPAEQQAFARAALAVRFPDREAPVRADQILVPRRLEDRDPSLWTTFNRVQEHLVTGGVRAPRVPGSRRTTTRGVNGIDGNVALNRALWMLAEEMRALRSVAA